MKKREKIIFKVIIAVVLVDIFIAILTIINFNSTEYMVSNVKEVAKFKNELQEETTLKYNVSDEEFGVNGEDSEDDTDGIQAALDKAKEELINSTNNEIEVFIPEGTYYINKALSIYSNTKLVLDDKATIEHSLGNTTMLIGRHLNDNGEICSSETCIHKGYTQWKNITVEGGTWNFNSNQKSNLDGFRLQHGENLTIQNTILINNAGHTLNISCSKDIVVENVTVRDQRSSEPKKPNDTNEAIHLDSASTGEPTSYPVDGTPVKNVKIQNCTLENVLCGIGSHTAYTDESFMGDNIEIKNNKFINVQCFAINLFAHKNAEISDNTATGKNENNIISASNEAYGFVQTYYADANIHNNSVSNFEYTLVNSEQKSNYTVTCDDESKINKFYILTYNSNGGEGTMAPHKYEYGVSAKISKNEFKKEGYKFVGWTSLRNYPSSQRYRCNELYENVKWHTQATIDEKSFTKYIYEDEESIETESWWHHSELAMTAQWIERSSINVSKKPDKLTYIQGKEELNLKGGIITSTYADGSTDTINLDEDEIKVTGFDNTKVGINTITVEYEGKTATFDVEIQEKTILKYNVIDEEFGANGEDEEDDTNGIQLALDKAKDELINGTNNEIEVYIPAGTYYISKRLNIYSNTRLLLDDNAIIISNIEKSAMLVARHLNENREICSSSSCQHGGYTQWQNISLEGGTWNFNNDGSSNPNGLIFAHGENLTVKNTTLINSAGHTLNPSCSKDVTIENVIIKDQISSEPAKPNNINEAMHLDSASTGEPGSYPLDGTPVKNVLIQNCIFENVLCGIGSHSDYTNENYMGDNIVIKNNTFNNVACYGVNLFAHKNVEIYDNVATAKNEKNIISTGNEGYGFVQTYYANANIHDNNVSNFEYTLVNSYKNSKYEVTCDDESNVNKFFIVTFNANGGEGTMPYQKCEYNSANSNIAKNEFKKKGYKFKGWIGFRNYPTEQTYKCNETFNNTTWHKQEIIDKNNLTKHIYEDEENIKTASWPHHSEVQMTAQWLERTNINISTKPTKLTYIQNNENLDLSGGIITSTYEDGSTDTINLDADEIKVTGFDNTKVGKNTITVEYEGKTTTFEVEIVESLNKNMLGDIDKNNKITITDLILLKRHLIAGTKEEWTLSKEQQGLADLNEDGKVGISDLVLLKRIILENN